MTPREHYEKAEELLAQIDTADKEIKAGIASGEIDDDQITLINAGMTYAASLAQVHATLATVRVGITHLTQNFADPAPRSKDVL